MGETNLYRVHNHYPKDELETQYLTAIFFEKSTKKRLRHTLGYGAQGIANKQLIFIISRFETCRQLAE